jgi:hypothetical protein
VATPRKRYFRVADSILREPWDRDTKMNLVMLMAYLNTRWARDGIPDEEAGRALLCRADVAAITGRLRPDIALKSLRSLAEVVSMTIESRGDFTLIDWPKYAEFQEYASRTRGSQKPNESPLQSESESVTNKQEKKPPSATPAARARVRRSAGEVDPRVQTAWPAIRAAFAEHGTTLGESIAVDRSKLIAKRIDAGATTEDLVAAVHGYARAGLEKRGDYDPARYFRPQTIFKEDGFSDRVDAGKGPRPVRSGVSQTERMWGNIR